MASLCPSVQIQKIISTIEILILVFIVILVKGFLLFSPPLFKNVLFDLWLLNQASLPHNLYYQANNSPIAESDFSNVWTFLF